MEALKFLKHAEEKENHMFDLVLLDVMMPQLSGYDVCRKIREMYSLYDLPVIFLTAKNTTEDLITGFEAGGNDYITKPINKEELLIRSKTLITLKKTVNDHEEAKYKLLQDRMSPHFLFNMLNIIHSLTFEDIELLRFAVLKLADTYHFLTDQSNKKVIPFETEWQFINDYLELQKIIFTKRLSVEIEKKGDFNNILIPPLTIQPLIENSIRHDLFDKPDNCIIKVYAERKEDEIKIEILDNGSGLQDGEDLFSRSLGNILKRLKYYFEEANLEIVNRKEGGVRVVVYFRL